MCRVLTRQTGIAEPKMEVSTGLSVFCSIKFLILFNIDYFFLNNYKDIYKAYQNGITEQNNKVL